MLGAFLLSFFSGFLCLALIQICLAYALLQRFLRPHQRPLSASSPSRHLVSPLSVDPGASVSRIPRLVLQGDIWVAPVPISLFEDTVKVLALQERVGKDSKRKKDGSDHCPQIHPVRRHAKLEDEILIFLADDGSEEHIKMSGCSVLSVSGGKEFSRKWAKKYPIKLESKDRVLLAGSHACLLYLETSWEKEAWCQVLRAASRWACNTEDWYISQKKEFHDYFLNLYKAYPSFSNLAACRWEDLVEEKPRSIENEGGLSRRQKIWKKITKKGSLKGSLLESKGGSTRGDSKGSSLESKSSTGSQDLNVSALLQSQVLADEKHDSRAASGSSGLLDSEKVLKQEKSHVVDQGTMCWNMLFSRLFFDAYHNSKFQAECHRLIQKQLSKIITPGYIERISCSNLELGTMPPFFHSMQILPKDLDSIWSFEAGIEYSGGARIKLETRLDVHESISQDILLNQSLEPTLVRAVEADILRQGLESMEKSVKLDGNVAEVPCGSESMGTLNSDSGDTKAIKALSGDVGLQTSKGGWKSVFSRVADQVSQVPFTLSLRLVSLKGTLRVQIKGPPTDRIWFGFTSMPTIELVPEPSIGEHKITTSLVVAFFTNRIKMLVQDTLVLPNSESVYVPWMISETDDWIQRSAMPVPWDPNDFRDVLPPEELQTSVQPKDNGKSKETQSNPGVGKSDVSFENSLPRKNAIPLQPGDRGLLKPLLETLDSPSEPGLKGNLVPFAGRQEPALSDDPSSKSKFSSTESLEEKGKQTSRRARMLSLGKKVWEKLDEKGQNMLVKVREGLDRNEQAGQ